MTESFGIDILLLGFQESSEEKLKLIEHILVLVLLGILWHRKNVISQTLNHKELLEQRVHVTDATKILNAHIAGTGFFTVHQTDKPISILVSPPRRMLIEFIQIIQN
jgi:dihydropteroate synthase